MLVRIQGGQQRRRDLELDDGGARLVPGAPWWARAAGAGSSAGEQNVLEAAVVVGEHHPPLAAAMASEQGAGVVGEHGAVAGDRARELVEPEGRREPQAKLRGPAAHASRAGLGPVEHRREVVLGKVPEVEDALRRCVAGGRTRGVGLGSSAGRPARDASGPFGSVVGPRVAGSRVVRPVLGRARSVVGPGGRRVAVLRGQRRGPRAGRRGPPRSRRAAARPPRRAGRRPGSAPPARAPRRRGRRPGRAWTGRRRR